MPKSRASSPRSATGCEGWIRKTGIRADPGHAPLPVGRVGLDPRGAAGHPAWLLAARRRRRMLVWAGRKPCEVAGIRFCRPAPPHHVALLLGHGLCLRSGAMLQSLVDTAMTLRSTAVDPEALRAVTNEHWLGDTVRAGHSLIAALSQDPRSRSLSAGLDVSLRGRWGAVARLRGPGRAKHLLARVAPAEEEPVSGTPVPRGLRAGTSRSESRNASGRWPCPVAAGATTSSSASQSLAVPPASSATRTIGCSGSG